MRCPACREEALREHVARNGVLVDSCPRCRGVWLDRGEVFLFSGKPRRLEARLSGGLLKRGPSVRRCPRCDIAMETGGFPPSGPEVDRCPQCEGFWFDADELQQVVESGSRDLRIVLDPMGASPSAAAQPLSREVFASGRPKGSEAGTRDGSAERRLNAIATGLTPLPNLFIRSAGVFALLYGILGAVLIALVEIELLGLELAVGIGVGIVLLQYAIGPWMMDLSLRWMYRFSWVPADRLPEHLRRFVERVASEHRMRFPRFGLIHDGAPNAFTYGHTPSTMRIVISQGILDLLEPEETEAVVAHEIGHGKHWDMALMTMAQLVPLLLYYLYRTLIRMRSRGRDKSAPYRLAIAVGAYVLYVVSEYLVLWFSRCREYHADRFAGQATGNPNALASALVKIAYGLAAQGKRKRGREEEAEEERAPAGALDALGAMGIFDAGAARALVATSATGTTADAPGNVGKENLKSAMQWDLWNPWARFYELQSTHPLVAHRLQYLAEQSAAMKQEPYIVFDRRQPESYWDEFLVDLLVMALPFLAPLAVGGVLLSQAGLRAQPALWGGWSLAALGVGMLVRTLYAYRGGFFAPLSVAGLLHKVKVSSVRPVPARVRGTVIGRGVPGLIWSEDFVIRDDTGILFLDYRQPLRIWEWLFGLTRAGDFTGKQIEVTGWYRRAPVPYLEIKSLTMDGRVRRCYAWYAKAATAVLAIGAGVVIALW